MIDRATKTDYFATVTCLKVLDIYNYTLPVFACRRRRIWRVLVIVAIFVAVFLVLGVIATLAALFREYYRGKPPFCFILFNYENLVQTNILRICTTSGLTFGLTAKRNI